MEETVFSDALTDYSYAAFEPSPKSHAALTALKNREFPGDKNITTYQMAVGDQCGKIVLVGEDTPSATFAQNTLRASGTSIPVTTLDNSSLGKVTCIKADIEGAELALLHGAEQTIVKHRPALLISAYHKRLDFIELTNYIDSLEIGYLFFLRHHTPVIGDTVCYMIPQN